MTKLLIQVGGPRSGSSNLERIIRSFGTVEAFAEIFTRNGKGMDFDRTAAYAAHLGLAFADPVEARMALRAKVRRDPVAACRDMIAYAEKNGRPIAAFKLFPGFLKASSVDGILGSFRPAGLLLHRRPIDAFISHEKARALDVWQKADTTEFKPRISVREFLFWKWKQQNLYQMAGLLFRRRGLKLARMRYEELYAPGVDPAAYVRDRCREVGLELGDPAEQFRGMKKQDAEVEPANKVANWDEFVAGLRRASDLRQLEDYDFDGSPALLRSQIALERLVPDEARRTLALSLSRVGLRFGMGARDRSRAERS